MPTCKIILDDEIHARVIGLNPGDAQILYDKFGIYVEGYRYTPLFRFNIWDGKTHFYSEHGKTYVKLLHEIVPYLEKWGYQIELEDKRTWFKPIEERITDQYFAEHGRVLRPYQVDSVNELLDEGSGYLIAGTGAGKTSITASLSSILTKNGYRCITIVPSADLVDQTWNDYISLGIDAGRYSGDYKELHREQIVSTWQSLQYNPQLIMIFNSVIIDECHGLKGEVVRKLVAEHGKHIAYRFGVTGTFPKPEVDQMQLKISVGKIVKEIPARWLIDNGYLSDVHIQPVETQEESENLPDYASEKSYISKNEDRIAAIAQFIAECRQNFGNTLVIVNSVKAGKQLAEFFEDCELMYGDTAKDIRKDAYSKYEEKDDHLAFATSGIASTGISINRVFCMIMVDYGKAFIGSIQTIGRSLRKGRDKNHAQVFDVYSKLKFSKKHSKERIKHYNEAGYETAKPLKLKY